jgi:hypothetical protein
VAEDRCPVTELIRPQCAHCQGKDLPKPEPLHWFPAQYAGFCAQCGKTIDRGDKIARTEYGDYICKRRHG